jgi:hypothetical protein
MQVAATLSVQIGQVLKLLQVLLLGRLHRSVVDDTLKLISTRLSNKIVLLHMLD